MPSELNNLEIIGLAFVSGLTATEAVLKSHQECENEDGDTKDKDEMNVVTGVLEGKEAEMFKKFMKEMGVE